jgi:hypothetical protein
MDIDDEPHMPRRKRHAPNPANGREQGAGSLQHLPTPSNKLRTPYPAYGKDQRDCSNNTTHRDVSPWEGAYRIAPASVHRALANLGIFEFWQDGEVLQTLLKEDATLGTQLQLQLDKQLCTAQPCNCKECATAKLSLRQLLHTATRLNPITRLLPATKITNLTVNTNTVPQSQLTRWRRWTPSELTKQPMQLQISMEQTLTARWRANITLFLLPWANYIPTLAAEAATTTGTPQGHWLGKNRWGTIRAKTILLQKLAKIGYHPMPPTPRSHPLQHASIDWWIPRKR